MANHISVKAAVMGICAAAKAANPSMFPVELSLFGDCFPGSPFQHLDIYENVINNNNNRCIS